MKMSSLVVNHLPLMKKFVNMKPSDKRKLICEDEKFVKCICEVCLNLLKGNVPVNKHQKKKLRRHKNIIRKLSRNVKNIKNKKKLLQKGGGVFLPLLFSIIGPIISKLIADQ